MTQSRFFFAGFAFFWGGVVGILATPRKRSIHKRPPFIDLQDGLFRMQDDDLRRALGGLGK
jgi:hypothetical protein